MPVRRLKFAESALSDLEEIQAWYTEQGVPAVGRRLTAEIFARVEALAEHPAMGRKVPEFDLPFLRELIHPPFRIVYRWDELPEGETVVVVRVWRSERVLKLLG